MKTQAQAKPVLFFCQNAGNYQPKGGICFQIKISARDFPQNGILP